MVVHRTTNREVPGSSQAAAGNLAFSLSSLSFLSLSGASLIRWRCNTTGFQLNNKMKSLAGQLEAKQA